MNRKTARKHLAAAVETGELPRKEASVSPRPTVKEPPKAKARSMHEIPNRVPHDQLASLAASALGRIKGARLGDVGVEAVRAATASLARIERELAGLEAGTPRYSSQSEH